MIDFSAFTAPVLHPVFEAIAYFVAGVLYRSLRKRQGDSLQDSTRMTIIVAAIIGAAVGSKLLHHFASPSEFMAQLEKSGPEIAAYLMGGKTIVGALLGGWISVEWMKRRAHIQSRTGDLFALPLICGMAIGRLGCLFAGPMDDTLGVATTGFFGSDFGDGILRHPTPLYEIFFLLILGATLLMRQRAFAAARPWQWCARTGDGFRLFLFSYLLFRLWIDFLKPYEVVFGLRIIQWACLFGLVLLVRDFFHARTRPPTIFNAP